MEAIDNYGNYSHGACLSVCVHVCMCVFLKLRFIQSVQLLRKVRRSRKRKSMMILINQILLQYKLFLPKTKGNLNPKVSLRKPGR